MKILKIAFPILLALVILLCVLFPVLSMFQSIVHDWLFNQTMNYYGYYSYLTLITRANANVLGSGSLPLLSILPISSSILDAIVSIITDSLVPFAIAIICALILALYFVLMKTKTSLSVSGSLAKVLKIVSIVLLGGGILTSLLILLPSLIMALFTVASLIIALFDAEAYTYWSSLFANLLVAIMSIITVLVFLFITAALAILLVILLKSKNQSTLVSKKVLIASTIISGVGAVASLLITLHYSYSRLASIIIYIFSKSTLWLNVNPNIIHVYAFFLILLLICVFGGFVVYLIKSIFAIKQLKSGVSANEDDSFEQNEEIEETENIEALTEENEAIIAEQAL